MLTQKEVLKDKIEAKKKMLEASLAKLKADGREAATNERDEIQTRLEELESTVKDGWNNFTEETSKKLNRWLGDDDE